MFSADVNPTQQEPNRFSADVNPTQQEPKRFSADVNATQQEPPMFSADVTQPKRNPTGGRVELRSTPAVVRVTLHSRGREDNSIQECLLEWAHTWLDRR